MWSRLRLSVALPDTINDTLVALLVRPSAQRLETRLHHCRKEAHQRDISTLVSHSESAFTACTTSSPWFTTWLACAPFSFSHYSQLDRNFIKLPVKMTRTKHILAHPTIFTPTFNTFRQQKFQFYILTTSSVWEGSVQRCRRTYHRMGWLPPRPWILPDSLPQMTSRRVWCHWTRPDGAGERTEGNTRQRRVRLCGGEGERRPFKKKWYNTPWRLLSPILINLYIAF